ncbi:MAG: ribonuclease T [Legionellales bacterium]|nr:ribonuclease T [Legionellales bacterium]
MTDIMSQRFRGYLPIVIDVETAGFNPAKDALLEIAAVMLHFDNEGILYPGDCHAYHIEPFAGANLEESALKFTGINPDNPFRFAIDEKTALSKLFHAVREEIKNQHCQRAVLVGHNAWFDHSFLYAAANRCQIKRNPFHPFTTFDTATLGGLVFGQTVLARMAQAAKIAFDPNQAHSAIYDTQLTAKIFCYMVNRWQELGGWPY